MRDARCTIFARVARPLHTEKRRSPSEWEKTGPRRFFHEVSWLRGEGGMRQKDEGRGRCRECPDHGGGQGVHTHAHRFADAAAAGRRVSSRCATGPGAPPLERTILFAVRRAPGPHLLPPFQCSRSSSGRNTSPTTRPEYERVSPCTMDVCSARVALDL